MHQRKGKLVLIYFLLLLIVASINNVNFSNLKFNNVEKINISGLNYLENEKILKDINNLNLENIFLLNSIKINNIINSNSLVEEFKVFKKYPSTINIDIEKTIFLAKINHDEKILILGSNGKFIKNDSSIKDLPYIFGNPEISDFLNFKKIIENSKISYEAIKNIYFFKSDRWDLELKNNILIKLPKNNVKETLDNVSEFMEDISVGDKIIIDARIENQIILNG